MPRKHPLAQHEQEIGHRIKQVRVAAGYPRSFLAFRTGTGHSVITFMELGRTVVKYGFALKFCAELNINPVWLATGIGSVYPSVPLPTIQDLGGKENARFYEVYSDKLAAVLNPEKGGAGKQHRETDWEISESRRQELIEIFINDLIKNTEVVRSDTLDRYLLDVASEAQKIIKPDWKDSWENTVKRRQSRIEQKRQFVPEISSAAKKYLTDAESSGLIGTVKAQMPELLGRIKQAASAPGKKTELANYLKAPLASVSRWLSGEREPGGEIALQMDAWATGQGYPKRPSNQK